MKTHFKSNRLNKLNKLNRSIHSKQHGLSFISLLFVGGVLAATGVVLAQVIPTIIEYAAVDKAINKAKLGSTVAEVRDIFDKATSVEDIKSIRGQDLEIAKEGDTIVVKFAYQREIHLFGPAFLTLKYSGVSK